MAAIQGDRWHCSPLVHSKQPTLCPPRFQIPHRLGLGLEGTGYFSFVPFEKLPVPLLQHVLGLQPHPDNTWMGRTRQGCDFLGYQISEAGITVAAATVTREVGTERVLSPTSPAVLAPPPGVGTPAACGRAPRSVPPAQETEPDIRWRQPACASLPSEA